MDFKKDLKKLVFFNEHFERGKINVKISEFYNEKVLLDFNDFTIILIELDH